MWPKSKVRKHLELSTHSHTDIAVVRRSNYHYFSNFSIANL